MFSLALCVKTVDNIQVCDHFLCLQGGNNLASAKTQTFLVDVMGISRILHILFSGMHVHRETPQLSHSHSKPFQNS